MLAEQTESVERARAVKVIDEYTRKEQVRINALSDAIGNGSNASASTDMTLAAIKFTDSRDTQRGRRVRSSSALGYVALVIISAIGETFAMANGQYGTLNQNVRNSYETH